jgi:hypothetical protein
VSEVPGMYVVIVMAHWTVSGCNTQDVIGTVDAVKRNFSISIGSNPGLLVVPAHVAPDTVAYGQQLDSVSPACAYTA